MEGGGRNTRWPQRQRGHQIPAEVPMKEYMPQGYQELVTWGQLLVFVVKLKLL